MKKTYAAIDIGTNSVRLLTGQWDGHTLQGATKELITARIGEGLADTAKLSKDAMQRNIDAVSSLIKRAKEKGANMPVFCFATSAVREAENGSCFMQQLHHLKDLQAELISGQKEAELAFYAAAQEGSTLVVDIGGGSTEVALGTNKELLSVQSKKIGVVTLFETFCKEDPISTTEKKKMEAYILKSIQALKDAMQPSTENFVLKAVGGTATQIAMLLCELKAFDAKVLDGFCFTKQQVTALYEKLATYCNESRKELVGMDPTRADVILTGSALLSSVMQIFGAQQGYVSIKDGLDAYLIEKLKQYA